MKVLSLFSGIGAFEKALERRNIKYELVNYCEIDAYSSKSYSLIHNVSEDYNLWDVTKVDTSKLPKDIDLITYGFPCQDISIAGFKKGLFNDDGTRTRSGLFFDALRIIEDTKPKYAIAENVKNLMSKSLNAQFQIILASLEAAGYNNYFKVLSGIDYGIPQNRQRVFIVSIRKDIDTGFTFPKPQKLKLKPIDLLEDEVDEKYYKICPSMIKAFEQGKIKDLTNADYANTLTTKMNRWNNCGMVYRKGRLSFLTPRESFRLMGFDDEDFDKIEGTISETQLYKQAGNSIIVNVLEHLFESLFSERKKEELRVERVQEYTIFDFLNNKDAI